MKQEILPHGEELSRTANCRRSKGILFVMMGLLVLETIGLGAPSGKQLYYNQDCTDFFWWSQIPAG